MPNTIKQVLKYKKFIDDVKSGKIKLSDSKEDRRKWENAAFAVYGIRITLPE